ncbi:MAG: hypothetical protein R2856_17940 [Caldilineaceae bacterium]
MKIYRPALVQGNLRKKNYFEGWYFKLVDRTEQYAFALIPGIALAEDNAHAFIQVLSSHEGRAQYHSYPVTAFAATDDPFSLKVGESTFSLNEINLSVDDGGQDHGQPHARQRRGLAGAPAFPGAWDGIGLSPSWSATTGY